jgi:hypothetical protein
VFGRIYSGMSVIQRMGMVATDADNRPNHAITIHKATPYRGPPPPPPVEEQMDSTQPAHMRIAAS